MHLQWLDQLLSNFVFPYPVTYIFCLFLTLPLLIILKLKCLRDHIVRQESRKNVQSFQFSAYDKHYSRRLTLNAKETSQVPQQALGMCDLISCSLRLSKVGVIPIYRESS